MQFNVETDTGPITLWIAPSNPTMTPAIAVALGEREPVVLSASVMREDVRSYGLHATGLCGFDVTEALVPGLIHSPIVTIREVETGLLVYRRDLVSKTIEGRLFRLETSARRHPEIDAPFEDRFHVAYAGLEQYSAETAKSVVRIPYVVSLYASGRLPLEAVEDVLLRHSYKLGLVVRDPVAEVFDRLQMLADPEDHAGTLATLMPSSVSDRIATQLTGLDMRRLDQIGTAIGRLDNDAIAHLSDPLTRQLVQSTPGQPLPRDAAQRAVLRMAEIDVVAPESDLETFFQLASAVMGADPPFEPPATTVRPAAISAVLRGQAWFIRLVRNDLAVYDAFMEAAASVGSTGADGPEPAMKAAGR